MPAWYKQTVQQTMEQLESSGQGLSAAESRTRIARYGPNTLKQEKRVSKLALFFSQFKDVLIYILLAASLVSFAVGEVTDGLVILLIVGLNALLGYSQENKANRALAALKKLASPMATVIRDGEHRDIPAGEIVPGDLVVVETGDFIPADLRLTEAVNLKIDESSLTGESTPVAKDTRVRAGDIPLGDQRNMAFMGTFVAYGRGMGLAAATGMGTQMGAIAHMLESVEEGDTPLQKKLARFSSLLGVIAAAIVAVVFLLGLLRDEPLLAMFMTAISLAVAAIPEGLPAIVTIVLALGMKRMISRHVIVKRLPAVETLGSVTTICSDKTGTLTRNEMTVTQLYTPSLSCTLEDLADKHPPGVQRDITRVLTIGALNNDAKLSREGSPQQERMIGDPTEGSLLVAARHIGLDYRTLQNRQPRLREIPFDSKRKRMATVHASEQTGYFVAVKGAPDSLLACCTRIQEQGEIRPLTDSDRRAIMQANNTMAGQALRVLAFGFRAIATLPDNPEAAHLESQLVFAGLMGMTDPPRPEAVAAIKTCIQAGIRPVMITGDYIHTAKAIAGQMGILTPGSRAMDGADIDGLDDGALQEAVRTVSVFARVSPNHKMRIVKALRETGAITSMNGDGVNDAPSLKAADIGVAMGITGTDVAKEAADMVLTDDNFASIVAAVEEGRVIFSNIRKFVYFLLSCNLGEIAIIFFAMIAGMPIPLHPIQILWLNLITDAFPALALGLERGHPHTMKQPPRAPGSPIIDRCMAVNIVLQSLAMTIAVLGVFYWSLHSGYPVDEARNFAFVTLIVSELLRSFTARSQRESIFQLGLFSNRYIVAGAGLSFALLLLVLYVPFAQPIFHTRVLQLAEWAIVFLFALLPSLVAEAAKFFSRKKEAKQKLPSAVLCG